MFDLIKECEQANVIGISGHIRPDGDCIGSCMALQMYLRKKLPKARIYVYLEESCRNFPEIPYVETADTAFTEQEYYDVFFSLDTSPDRLGGAQKLYQKAKKTINIDHHITNSGCGDVNLMRPEIGSCAEIIYDLIPKEDLDRDIARALYIGIIHDTGVFQYSNTRPSTLRAGAELIRYDIDFANLIQESFYQKTYKQTKIMAEAVLKSEMFLQGHCLATHITGKEMQAYEATNHDFTGIINRLKNVKGVDCAVFMYEMEPGNYKISLRTSDRIDATKVVTAFGGGGHARAAGCNICGTYEDIMPQLNAEIEKQLQENQ